MPPIDGRSPLKRRVLHVVAGGDVGGAERLVHELASRPEETAADHQIAVFASTSALADYFHQSGALVHRQAVRPESALGYLRESLGGADVAWLAARLREQQIDVVHTHTFRSHVLGTRAARLAGLPQLRTEHHVMHFSDPSCSPFTRWAAARTDRFVAVSEYVRRVLSRLAPTLAARTTTIRNGVDTQYWSPRPPAVASRPFSATVVSRLTGWKRVEMAIDAAARAEVELVVVGDGEERSRLEARARASGGRVTFVGHQADPRPFLAQGQVSINTSRREPLGLSVLESLSMERPVIAFADGGIPEIVQHGRTGLLVQEETATALAAALREARADTAKLEAMGRRGRAFTVEEASVEVMCRGYATQYRELARSS